MRNDHITHKILSLLDTRDGVRGKDIQAAITDLTPGAVTHRLVRMENEGWIVAFRDPAHRTTLYYRADGGVLS